MGALNREEHGEARKGRITSTSATLLMSGTQAAWLTLSKILDNPPDFFEATFGPMQEGVKREPEIARRFFVKHPEVKVVEDPKIVYHHDENHPYHSFIATSPDRVIDGIPLECKWVMKRSRWEKLRKPMAAGFSPPDFRDQIDWHMWVMGTNKAWLAVGTDDRYEDLLYQRADLSHIDVALARFMEQYANFNIKGIKR